MQEKVEGILWFAMGIGMVMMLAPRLLRAKPRRVESYVDNDSMYRLRAPIASAEALLMAQDTGRVIYIHDPATGAPEHVRVLMKDHRTGEVEFQLYH